MKKLVLFLSLVCIYSTYAQEDSTKSGVNFDFGLTRNKNVNLWPVFKRSKTKSTTEISALLNLIGYLKNSEYSIKHGHVFPLFFNTKTATTKDIRIGTTYYPTVLRYTQDENKKNKTYSLGEIAPYIRFLQLSTSENGLEVDNNLFFFMWYNKSEAEKSTSFVTFPLVWYYKKPTSKLLTIAPIYSQGEFRTHFTETDQSYKMITPLYWNFKNNTDTTHFLFPIYHAKNSGNHSSVTIFPLLYNKTTSPTKTSLSIFPIYQHTLKTNHEEDFTTVKETSESRMITPLYWSYNSKKMVDKTLFPLFNFHKDSISEQFISPLYAKRVDSISNYKMVTPLLWNIKTKYDTTSIIAPFYVGQKSKDQKTSFIPLLLAWKKTTKNTTSYNQFPLFFTENDTLYKEKRQSIALLFYHRKNKTTQIVRLFPLFGYKKNSNVNRFISPIYINAKKTYIWDSSQTKALLPFYLKTNNKNRIFSTVFPIYWSYENAAYKSIYVLPFGGYGKAKNLNRGFLNVTPFYWNIKQPNKTKNLVLPFWYSSTEYQKDWKSTNDSTLPKIDTIQKRTLFPFYWSRKDANSTHQVLLPLYSKYDYDYSSKYNLSNEKRRTYGLFIYNFHHKYSSENYNNEKAKYGVFPLYFHKTFTNILANSDTIVNKHTVLFPLYWNYSTKDKTSYSSRKVFFPLFWKSKNQRETKTTLFPIFSYTGDHLNSKELYLLPNIHWKKNSYDTTFTFLPIFHYKHSNSIKRNYLIPFYFYEFQKNNHKSIKSITPLFWQIADSTKKTTLLLPLIDYTRNKRDKDINLGILGFIFRYKSTENEKNFKFLYPLIEYKKTEEKMTFRISPLFWMKQTDDVSYNTLLPIYYFKKTEDTRFLNLLFGLYSYKKSNLDAEKSHRILWSLLYFNKSTKGKATRLGYFLYKNIEKESITEKAIFPFYSFESNSSGKNSRSFVFKCFQSNELPIEGSNEKYKEIKVLWFIRLGSNYNYLHDKGLM